MDDEGCMKWGTLAGLGVLGVGAFLLFGKRGESEPSLFGGFSGSGALDSAPQGQDALSSPLSGPSDSGTSVFNLSFPTPTNVFGDEMTSAPVAGQTKKQSSSSKPSSTVSGTNPYTGGSVQYSDPLKAFDRDVKAAQAKKTLASVPASEKTMNLTPIKGVHPTKKENKKTLWG
jgi:hypothetical protein